MKATILPFLRDWWSNNKPKPAQLPVSQMTLAMRETRIPMTADERRAADALDKIIHNGPWDRTRIRMIVGAKNLSPSGRAMLWRLCWKYRAQITSNAVLQDAIAEHEKTEAK